MEGGVGKSLRLLERLKAHLKGGLAREARLGGSENREDPSHFLNPTTAFSGPPPLSGEALNVVLAPSPFSGGFF